MLKSDTDLFVESWSIGTKYLFKSYNYFSLDFIVLKRIDENTFECCKNSTINISSFSKEEIVKLIGMNLFIHEPYISTEADLHDVRSNGCTCGSNATTEKEKHAFHCRKYKI